ncbi:MAG TPA: GNAT family protein [Candidatus Dormibacteraeota bacterium]|nr:GNAT family protein [Candidatus Dormibacteraeota bacterium]
MLRQVRKGDEPTLLRIFSDPTVSRWWGDPKKSVEDTMAAEEGDEHYLIEVDGEAIGMIQSYEESDDMYRHAGIDISIREPWQGKGLGPEAIKVLARYLIDERGHHRLVIDPAALNVNAIKAYERVGFKPVGVMRRYERGLDGEWHDGLLMDLLAEELTD